MYCKLSCESYAESYIDDIAVYSQTWEEHLEHLGEVFRQFVSADLHVKLHGEVILGRLKSTTWEI